ncbi:MAG TPA: DUF2508 family protein [Emticicia sp.]
MTYLNNDLQVRRELTERIQKLQAQLDEEKQNSQNIADTITEYVVRKERAEQKYKHLIITISNVADTLPDKHRRQILNNLPDL